MLKLKTKSSHLLYTLLLSMLLFGCEKSLEESDEEKSFTISKMDLGMALWKNKIKTFDGDIKKADSAYEIDKKILIDDIYKTAEKVKNINNIKEKECGHILFNKYCQLCKEYRLENGDF